MSFNRARAVKCTEMCLGHVTNVTSTALKLRGLTPNYCSPLFKTFQGLPEPVNRSNTSSALYYLVQLTKKLRS